jgi:mannose/fructose/N-acetylgalactosamine-specific phosphotransferase system component IIB
VIALLRVDNRLIHGQVVEAWLPHLHATRILVADDEAAANPLARAAMSLAIPSPVKVEISPLASADFAGAQASPERVLVLVRDIAGAVAARERGLAFATLNLGNVHFASGRVQVSPSVFLTSAELESLRALAKAGVAIDLRAIPKDKPLALADIEARFAAGGVAHG